MQINEAMHACVLMLRGGEITFSKGNHTHTALSLVLGELGRLQKHCYPHHAIVIGKEYCCPECKRPVHLQASVCHRCGKALDWQGVIK